MTNRFRDQRQQQPVCDRILRLAHFNLETVRSELLQVGDLARVRRARLLYDPALALWDGDNQVALGHLVDLDRDTRTAIGDPLVELGVTDHSHIDRWLASTDAGRRTGVYPKRRAELVSFARIWFLNLRAQGFLGEGARREAVA